MENDGNETTLKPGDFCLCQIVESGEKTAVLEVIDKIDTTELLEETQDDQSPAGTRNTEQQPSKELPMEGPQSVLRILEEQRKVLDRAIAALQAPSNIPGPEAGRQQEVPQAPADGAQKDRTSPISHRTRRFTPSGDGAGNR